MFEPEVAHILLHSCQELILSLDLSGVSHHNLTLQVKDSGQVRIGNIKSSQARDREHQLNIQLEDVDKFIIEKQTIEEALTISSSSVGEVLIYQSALSSIPPPGLTLENADKVSLIDSVFSNTASGSISVDTVGEVEIVNNQFSRDIIELLKTNNSQNLYISCNRLLGEAVNLECATISSALDTLSSVPSLAESSSSSVSSAALDIKSERNETPNENTILWLLLVISLVILTVIFICICLRRRKQHKDEDDEEKNALNSNIETEKQEALNVDAEDQNLNGEISICKNDIVVDDDYIIEKVKEQEAILQDEIKGLQKYK